MTASEFSFQSTRTRPWRRPGGWSRVKAVARSFPVELHGEGCLIRILRSRRVPRGLNRIDKSSVTETEKRMSDDPGLRWTIIREEEENEPENQLLSPNSTKKSWPENASDMVELSTRTGRPTHYLGWVSIFSINLIKCNKESIPSDAHVRHRRPCQFWPSRTLKGVSRETVRICSKESTLNSTSEDAQKTQASMKQNRTETTERTLAYLEILHVAEHSWRSSHISCFSADCSLLMLPRCFFTNRSWSFPNSRLRNYLSLPQVSLADNEDY